MTELLGVWLGLPPPHQVSQIFPSLFERWLIEHLAALTDPEQTRLLRPFTTWQVLPWLRRRAEAGPLTSTSRSYASQQVKRATDFIAWARDQHLTVADLRQEHLDRWLVTHRGHHRQNTKPFLDWAIRTGQMPAWTCRPSRPCDGNRSPSTAGSL